jgi:hypothetical protein
MPLSSPGTALSESRDATWRAQCCAGRVGLYGHERDDMGKLPACSICVGVKVIDKAVQSGRRVLRRRRKSMQGRHVATHGCKGSKCFAALYTAPWSAWASLKTSLDACVKRAKATEIGHPRCGKCTILFGRGHEFVELMDGMCAWCHGRYKDKIGREGSIG